MTNRTHLALFLSILLPMKAALPAQQGRIVGWGSQVVGADLSSGFVKVAGGMAHSVGLRRDGSVVCWGDNEQGQCGVPAPNAGFAAIAAGADHSLGLKQDGSIVAWGRNVLGQCDVPAPNTGFVAVAGGGEHSLGVKQDGSLPLPRAHGTALA
jgi:hypothetical protein